MSFLTKLLADYNAKWTIQQHLLLSPLHDHTQHPIDSLTSRSTGQALGAARAFSLLESVIEKEDDVEDASYSKSTSADVYMPATSPAVDL
jgi:hypothetical protein